VGLYYLDAHDPARHCVHSRTTVTGCDCCLRRARCSAAAQQAGSATAVGLPACAGARKQAKCAVCIVAVVCKGWGGGLRGTTLRAQSQPAGASTIWLCTITRKTHTHTCVCVCVCDVVWVVVCVSGLSCGLSCGLYTAVRHCHCHCHSDPQWTTANRLGTPHICHCGEVFRVVRGWCGWGRV
jgi:hypothetical protein